MADPARPSAAVRVHPDKEHLAAAAAARLALAVQDAQATYGQAHLALTGGSMGGAVLAALETSSVRAAIDWQRVHLWWGDERYLPTGDAERNDTQADEALLSRLPLPAEHVHRVAGPDTSGSVEQSAQRYAEELATAAPGEQAQGGAAAYPRFDVVMLGVGPDGHVASLFPHHPEAQRQDATVIPVHDSPKPPPLRVSLTFPALCSAREVWFLVCGEDKAEAVQRALVEVDPQAVPASAVSGTERTLWLVDRAAAARLP